MFLQFLSNHSKTLTTFNFFLIINNSNVGVFINFEEKYIFSEQKQKIRFKKVFVIKS